jgi:hypothetical protein
MSKPTLAATLIINRIVRNVDQLTALRRSLDRFLDIEVTCDMRMWKPTSHVWCEKDPYKTTLEKTKLLKILMRLARLLDSNYLFNVTFYIERSSHQHST